MYDPNSHKVFFSRDVVFNESKFIEADKDNKVDDDDELLPIEMEQCNEIMEQNENIEENQNIEQNERKSLRTRKIPNHYGEWVNVCKNLEPRSLSEALSGENGKDWNNAMANEINSLKENEVWDLVTLPEGRKTIGCKWVFKTKIDADGEIDRYKARLVAQGYNQKYGIDYDETFSPVVRFESIRTIIALAAKYGLKLHQMDVKSAFLNGELKEEIFMKQPEGFIVKGKETHVCKLKRVFMV